MAVRLSAAVSHILELPPLPTKDPPKFGKDCLTLFELDPNHCNLNHGSYGSTPKYVRAYQRHLQKIMDTQPDRWFKGYAAELYHSTLQVVSPLLGPVPIDSVALIPNVSFAWNSVFRSLRRLLHSHRPGANEETRKLKILHFATVFGPLRPVLQNAAEELGMEVIEVDVTYPISDDDLEAAARDAIGKADAVAGTETSSSSVCIAVIDAISSLPGVIVPFERLTALFKALGILTFVDAAHAIGQIPLDLSGGGPYGPAGVPDFFVSNCHKWLFSPVNSAVFYANPRFHRDILPAVIVHGLGDKSFPNAFFEIGTLDHTSLFSIPAAIHFRKWLGGEEVIRSYTHDLAVEGGKLMAEMFGTSIMVLPEEEEPYRIVGAMVNVRLPHESVADAFLADIQTHLVHDLGVSCFPFKHGGVWWARVSAQIYTDLEDFKVLGQTILKVLKNPGQGQ